MTFLDTELLLILLFFAGPVTFVVAFILWRNFRIDRQILRLTACAGTAAGTLLVPLLTFVLWRLPLDGGFVQLLLAPIVAGVLVTTVFLAWPQKRVASKKS